jgi:hypothetical protein
LNTIAIPAIATIPTMIAAITFVDILDFLLEPDLVLDLACEAIFIFPYFIYSVSISII